MDRRPPRKRNLTALFVNKVKPEDKAFRVWDLSDHGLVLQVQPTGVRSFYTFYSFNNRPYWYFHGRADRISLDDARRLTKRVSLQVAEGKNPLAERVAQRSSGSFAELALAYRERYAKKKNKSWKQPAFLIDRYVLPQLGKMPTSQIGRADIRAVMDSIGGAILANQTVLSTSAIFNWGIKEELVSHNPCKGIDLNETKARERVLSNSEVPMFWEACANVGLIRGMALRLCLLLGQRPGEVSHMRFEHLHDGWWTMPGAPDAELGWPGVKNGQSHRIWLPKAAWTVIDELAADDTSSGFVFGKAVSGLDIAMRQICAMLGIKDKITPHDLRRSHGSLITGLGHGRDALNRIQNHKEGGIADVYDRHRYETENKSVMETVADHIMSLVTGDTDDKKVVTGNFRSRG